MCRQSIRIADNKKENQKSPHRRWEGIGSGPTLSEIRPKSNDSRRVHTTSRRQSEQVRTLLHVNSGHAFSACKLPHMQIVLGIM